MEKLWKISLLMTIVAMLNSCNAPVVRNTLSLPGRTVRGVANTTGFGGVGGL